MPKKTQYLPIYTITLVICPMTNEPCCLEICRDCAHYQGHSDKDLACTYKKEKP